MLKKITKHYKRLHFTYMKLAGGILFTAALFFPSYTKWEDAGNNTFTIFLNGQEVGIVAEYARAEELLQETRRELVSRSNELVFIDVDMTMDVFCHTGFW